MLQSVLAPAGLFIQADTQRRLRDNFMREKGIRWMNAAQARVTHQSLVTRRAKYSVAARHVQLQIHHAPRTFHRPVYFAAKIFAGHCAP